MKKLALTLAIVLGLGMTSFAGPDNGGLFQRGEAAQNNSGIYQGNRDPLFPDLPDHGETGNQPAPLGSGVVLLTALGAAYLVGKRKNED